MSPRRTLIRTAAPYAAVVVVTAAAGLAGSRLSGEARPLVANEVTITAEDYTFAAPDTIPAGVTTFKLLNRGKEFHHATLIRLDEGKTYADFQTALKAAGPPPSWAVFVGGPNAPDPGTDANATVVLRPGRYVLICLVPSPDGQMHAAKGMVQELIVAPARAATELPPADVAVMLSDYDFKISEPLTAGQHTLRVRNYAAQPHEIELMRLHPGKTLEDLKQWLATEAGPPPAAGLGGVAALSQGEANNLAVDLTPGEYALVCFLPDSQDGKPHFVHGMLKGFTVE